ncbi:unnamed protein product, partial [Ixodes hexagonus]
MCDNKLGTMPGLQGLWSLGVLSLSGNRSDSTLGVPNSTNLITYLPGAVAGAPLSRVCPLSQSSFLFTSCRGKGSSPMLDRREIRQSMFQSILLWACHKHIVKQLGLINCTLGSLTARTISFFGFLQMVRTVCLAGIRLGLILTNLCYSPKLPVLLTKEEERLRTCVSWEWETLRCQCLVQQGKLRELLEPTIASSQLLWECSSPQVSPSALEEKTFFMIHASQHGSSEDKCRACLCVHPFLPPVSCYCAVTWNYAGAVAKLLCQSLSQQFVTMPKLHYVCFRDVFLDLVKVLRGLKNVNCPYLRCCRIDESHHLATPSRLPGLKSITIDEAGNGVTLLSAWKPYFIFCLSGGMEPLNSSPVS